MTDPILTEQELAALLRVPDQTVARLLHTTDLPRFLIEGRPRFLLEHVLAWLATQAGREIAPSEAHSDPGGHTSPKSVPAGTLVPARDDEVPWVPQEALDALGAGASDPGRNLDRLKLRDALLELNDVLLGALTRFSGGRLRLHHDEHAQTSPWRIEMGSATRITTLRMVWGAQSDEGPASTLRPQISVELASSHLTLRLEAAAGTMAPWLSAVMAELAAGGITQGPSDAASAADVLTKHYPLPTPTPTIAVLSSVLEADLARLVPLWGRCLQEPPRASG